MTVPPQERAAGTAVWKAGAVVAVGESGKTRVN